THYGAFKQCTEANARVFALDHGVSSVGLRPWAVYGVGRDVGITSGPTKAIKAVVAGRPYTIRFSGGVDLQYVNDTARIFLKCAEANLAGARVYTLRGTVVRMEEFIRALEREIPAARGLIRAEGAQLPSPMTLTTAPWSATWVRRRARRSTRASVRRAKFSTASAEKD